MNLKELENKSIFIIREAYANFKEKALLWSVGKDSTTLLWLCRKAFLGDIPFPVIHIDTMVKFDEIYEFRDYWAHKWGIDVIVGKSRNATGEMLPGEKFECCNELKTNALKDVLDSHNIEALLLGIRRDEHGIRAKERVFSARDRDFIWHYTEQSPEIWDSYKSSVKTDEHVRIHPLLEWTELDIWNYIHQEQIPVCSLYFSRNHKRYRSIGCKTCCLPVESEAKTVEEIIAEIEESKVSERSGRAQDKESLYVMQKLRALGYM